MCIRFGLSALAGMVLLASWSSPAAANAKFTQQTASAQAEAHVTGNPPNPAPPVSTSVTYSYPTALSAMPSVSVLTVAAATSFTSFSLPFFSGASLLPAIGQPVDHIYMSFDATQYTNLQPLTNGSFGGQFSATSTFVLDAPSVWKFLVNFNNTGSSSMSLHSMEMTGPNFDVTYSGGVLSQTDTYTLLPGTYTLTGSQNVEVEATSSFFFPRACYDESLFQANWVSDAPEPASFALLVGGMLTLLWRRR